MKILVIGKTGQLGKSLSSTLEIVKSKHNFVFVDRSQIDLINDKSVYAFLEGETFDVIIKNSHCIFSIVFNCWICRTVNYKIEFFFIFKNLLDVISIL